jgi:starch synthase
LTSNTKDATSNLMRILMITAEGPPLLRTGALIDVMNALPRELRERGHEISVVMPHYKEIRENASFAQQEAGITVDVRVGDKNYVAEFVEGHTEAGVQLFFIRCDPFFDRPGIYGEHGEPYEDNAARFIFFCKAAVELARRLTPSVQILHAHDWAAALVPVLVNAYHLPFSTVLTIHHCAEQGSFWGLDFKLTNLHERFFTLRGIEFFGRMNFLKGGILYADRITTVSEHYRREILTEEGGCGLHMVLRENAYKLTAIFNGADYNRWNPSSDVFLPARYDIETLPGKQFCREALIGGLGLALAPTGPVFGMVTRVVEEKGFTILMPVLDRLLTDDVRLIVLGEGESGFETGLAVAARKYPDKFVYQKTYDEKLAHVIEAGMDISLIPSKVEPSGVSAMYSLKYGALPVARATGGIQEIIQDHDATLDRGYGFLCYHHSSEAFWDSIKRARELFGNQVVWETLVKRAMQREFSWDQSAARYQELYADLIGAPADAEVAA